MSSLHVHLNCFGTAFGLVSNNFDLRTYSAGLVWLCTQSIGVVSMSDPGADWPSQVHAKRRHFFVFQTGSRAGGLRVSGNGRCRGQRVQDMHGRSPRHAVPPLRPRHHVQALRRSGQAKLGPLSHMQGPHSAPRNRQGRGADVHANWVQRTAMRQDRTLPTILLNITVAMKFAINP